MTELTEETVEFYGGPRDGELYEAAAVDGIRCPLIILCRVDPHLPMQESLRLAISDIYKDSDGANSEGRPIYDFVKSNR